MLVFCGTLFLGKQVWVGESVERFPTVGVVALLPSPET